MRTEAMVERVSSLVSVIVPVYNAEKYIHKCVDSLLAQTYTNFEIILVDDGSPDRCPQICDEYALRDNRVRVAHQENGGVSRARNRGIAEARGRWLVFIDSDDTIGPNYLSTLYENRVEGGLCMAGFYETCNGETTVSVDFGHTVYDQNSNSLPLAYKNQKILTHPSPLARVFDRELIERHGISFDSRISLCEDLLFWQQYMLHCKRVVTIPPVEYYYLKDNSTLSRRKQSGREAYMLASEYIRLSREFSAIHQTALPVEAHRWGGTLLMSAITSACADPSISAKDRHGLLMDIRSNFGEQLRQYYVPPTAWLSLKKWLFINMLPCLELLESYSSKR